MCSKPRHRYRCFGTYKASHEACAEGCWCSPSCKKTTTVSKKTMDIDKRLALRGDWEVKTTRKALAGGRKP